MLAAFVVLMAGDWSSGRAQPVASITLPPPGAVLQLYPGCNNIGVTFSDGTSSGAVLDAVSPAGSVETMWRHDAAQQRWEGFSAAAPAASDLLTVNFLDAIWLCLVGSPPTATPTPITPTTPAGQTATPASTATPTTPAGRTATPTSIAATPTTPAGPTPTRPAGPTPTPGTVSRADAPSDVLDSFRYSMDWSMAADAEMTVTIHSEGAFKAPDGIRCDLTARAGGMTFPMDKLIVIGDDAWIDTGSEWTPVPANDPNVVGDLQLCPGSSLFWEGFLPLEDLGGIQGQVAFRNGVLAVRLSLKGVVQSLPILGVIPPEATVNTFDIWVAQAGGWLVALQFDGTFPADGTGATSGDRIQLQVDVTNDPTVSINPPH
jgi:hypothetical protein